MSNRNDFAVLADELVELFKHADPMKFRERLTDELHNAFVAGRTHEYLKAGPGHQVKPEKSL